MASFLSPYLQILGERYSTLHPHVRTAHEAPLVAAGAVDVVHGRHRLTPFLIKAMKLPAAGAAKQVSLTLEVPDRTSGTPTGAMVWLRAIGDTRLNTRQFARRGHLVEESGPGTVEFVLRVDAAGGLQYEHAGCRVLGLRLPDWVSPRVRAHVAPEREGWRVDVLVEWRHHLICRYSGAMRPIAGDA